VKGWALATGLAVSSALFSTTLLGLLSRPGEPEGGPVPGPDCLTGELHCGETVTGHTDGGVWRFDSRFYEKKFCMPALWDHDGGDERVYRLTLPEGPLRAVVHLETPDADLDLVALRWDGQSCPTPESSIPRCETEPEKGRTDEVVELAQGDAPTTWLLVVEGKEQQEGPFALHVSCQEGLE
jgi:hypothetical protein